MDPVAEAVRVTRKLGRVDSVAFDVAQEKPSCLLGASSGTGGEAGSNVGGAAECGSMGGAEGTEISDDDSTCSESGGAAESSDSSSSSDGAPKTVSEFYL